MTSNQRREVRKLEGRRVHLALANGARIDDAMLVSAGTRTVWVYSNGSDEFVPAADVLDVWESAPLPSAA
jgi:hypothetical protein